MVGILELNLEGEGVGDDGFLGEVGSLGEDVLFGMEIEGEKVCMDLLMIIIWYCFFFIGDGDLVYILKSSNVWVDRIYSRFVLYCIVLKSDDDEVGKFRDRIISVREEIFKKIEDEVSKRWNFEEVVSNLLYFNVVFNISIVLFKYNIDIKLKIVDIIVFMYVFECW